MTTILTPPTATFPSAPRAWLALVALGLRRQARMRQMVWIALGLLALVVGIVAFSTATNGWSTANRRAFLHAADRPRLLTPQRPADDHPVRRTFRASGELSLSPILTDCWSMTYRCIFRFPRRSRAAGNGGAARAGHGTAPVGNRHAQCGDWAAFSFFLAS